MRQPGPDAGAGTLRWLGEEWAARLAEVLESMTGERPTVEWGPREAALPVESDFLWYEQPFQLLPGPGAFAGAPEESWKELGKRALGLATADEAHLAGIRETYLEILRRCFSGLAQSLGTLLRREVVCAGGREGPEAPAGVVLHPFTVSYAGDALPPIRLAFSPSLLEMLETPEAESNREEPGRPGEIPAVLSSKTFDLLLEVELPVSISFGHARMPLQDVLKLTAGSIVELNRSVNDPVELIVNNCVVAVGEVVVVEGNYGVRIQQIVSREKRLWTSSHLREVN